MTANTAHRAPRAIIDLEPYPSLEDPSEPDWAEYSVLGTCPVHGLEPVTSTRVSGGSDPWELYVMACGRIDEAMTFGTDL
jgi:hypothetical protein